MSQFLDSGRPLLVKFTLTNIKRVPAGLKVYDDESLEEKVGRKMFSNGEQILGPVERTEVIGVLTALERLGWRIAGARVQKRLGKQLPPRKPAPYYDHRFRFQKGTEPSPQLWVEGFNSLTSQAYWQLRVYDNGEDGISVNFDGCTPKDQVSKGFVAPRLVCIDHEFKVIGASVPVSP